MEHIEHQGGARAVAAAALVLRPWSTEATLEQLEIGSGGLVHDDDLAIEDDVMIAQGLCILSLRRGSRPTNWWHVD